MHTSANWLRKLDVVIYYGSNYSQNSISKADCSSLCRVLACCTGSVVYLAGRHVKKS